MKETISARIDNTKVQPNRATLRSDPTQAVRYVKTVVFGKINLRKAPRFKVISPKP